MDILVIGAGVSGLSSAIRLLEAGHQVRIIARDLPHATTSAVAAAVWYPYRAYPEELVLGWSAATYRELMRLSGDPAAGIIVRRGLELFPEPVGDPWWRDAVPDFRRAQPSELPPQHRDGYVFSAPVVEMPLYLEFLLARFRSLGGTLEQGTVASLDEAPGDADALVNCTGLGARELVGDPAMLPIRGQIVRVAQVGVEQFTFDDYGPGGVTYIVPRSRDIVLGGTDEEGDERLAPDPATAEAILARCIALEPRLRSAAILEHRVGLRPGRPAVRLEAERRDGRLVVHNYGHGGAGVTLSWGCADEVARLVERG
ncbi:MAG: FAD-dependent oxidoreductase [Chloroflexota bacterium]